MIKKVSFFFFLGLILTIFLAQFDSLVHQKLIKACQDIAYKSLGCRASFSIESINFFSPSLVLRDVEMNDVHQLWSWKCKRCEIYSSWIQLLLKGMMDKHIIIDEFSCSSAVVDNACAIEPHIVALTSESLFPIPSQVKSLVFNKSFLSLHNEKNNICLSLFFNSSSLKIADRLKTMISFYNGFIEYDTERYCNDITIDMSLISWYENDCFKCSLGVSGLLNIPQMAQQGICYLSGSLDSWRGRFALRNAYNSFIVDPIIITEEEIRAESFMPLSYIIKCFNTIPLETMHAHIHGSLRIDKKEGKVNGHIIMQDCFMDQLLLSDVTKILFFRSENIWKFRLNIARKNEECHGTGYWNELTQQGKCEFYNHTSLSSFGMPHWRIAPKNLRYYLLINKQEGIGIYTMNAMHSLSKADYFLYGGFSYSDQGIFSLTGLLNSTEFAMKIQCYPYVHILEGLILDKDKKNLLFLHPCDNNHSIHTDISFALMRNFINTFFHYDIQGEGIFTVKGSVTCDNATIDVLSEDIAIRLPETYNFVNGLQSYITLDFLHKHVTLENTIFSLHSGNINCPRAVAWFDDSRTCKFAYASFLFDHCLFNIKKDLFAIVSGNIHFCHNKKNKSYIKGAVFIDKGQLKENILSEAIQKKLFSYTPTLFPVWNIPLQCDLTIETKSPIKIDTKFLQTHAKVNLTIQNDITEPSVSGAIILQSGFLNFPYKPLLIHKGVLNFSPEQSYDPTIELIARNQVKNYDISLQVVGSLLNHHIMLDSTPPLSEEQIMTLLLVGSQESSLNSMIPALIVQNLKNLIFSHNQSTFFEKYFAPLLRPLHINIIPSFADQTGRGGLRGILEVSINDRWRALLQKNFSLTEDTRVELEFSVSDNITLRGMRDERRDLGGEIEMRWKF